MSVTSNWSKRYDGPGSGSYAIGLLGFDLDGDGNADMPIVASGTTYLVMGSDMATDITTPGQTYDLAVNSNY